MADRPAGADPGEGWGAGSAGHLSRRGDGMLGGGLSPYLLAGMERAADPGFVNLAVAENLQQSARVLARMASAPAVPAEALAYGDLTGSLPLRQALAGAIGRELFGRSGADGGVDPDHLVVMAGASPVIEALGNAIGDPGEGILVPTPSYAGFWPDLQVRPGLQVVEVPTSAADGWALTPERLVAAVEGTDVPVRALLLTNPDNPRGQVRPATEVRAVVQWALDAGLHVIADEVYGMSPFDGGPFPSVGRLWEALPDRLHVVWALSKDLGMSGSRVGVLVTADEAVRQAAGLQALWSGVGGHLQHLVTHLLGDAGWLAEHLAVTRQGLADVTGRAGEVLTAAGVPFGTPTAGFFVLADLREFLPKPTWAAEEALWRRVLEGADVNLTPGSALRAPEPGWFRICLAAHPPEVVLDALQRTVPLLHG